MPFLALLSTLLLLPFALAAPISTADNTTCAPIHIIAARGSNEAPGPGRTASLAALIQAAHPGTDLESIIYPARLFPYDESSSAGTMAVTTQLTAYVNRCPSSKIVMLGYSQGAHILLDSLCGGGGDVGLGPETPPIGTVIGDHVIAIVQYGDPRHITDVPYDTGTSMHDGLFPRKIPSQSCAHYDSVIRSWCDAGDPFCSEGFDLQQHLDYPQKYDLAAAAFVEARLSGA